MFDGPSFTFGKNPADTILFFEASKDSRDLTRVSNILQDYNEDFNDMVKAYGIKPKTKEKALLLFRDRTLGIIGCARWHNPKIVTFLRNAVKTRYTIYIREKKEAAAVEKARRKAPPIRLDPKNPAEFGTHVCHDNYEYPLNGAGCCDRCGEI